MNDETARTPVILHYADYRGDHAADARRVMLVNETTTVADLRAMVDKAGKYGAAWIEVGAVDDLEPEDFRDE